MITKKTVFLLGAGASRGCGYPSGQELLIKIVRTLREPTKSDFNELVRAGFDPGVINSFRDQLHRSGLPSVDRFLELNPAFIEVGKAAIAIALLRLENPAKLLTPLSTDPDGGDSWYPWLFNKVTEGAKSIDEIGKNQLSIVSFNYDRSLCEFFVDSLSASYTVSRDEAFSSLKKAINFYHVYGSLGELAESKSEGSHAYAMEISPDRIKKAAGQIKIISEERGGVEIFEHIKMKFADSQTIVILGFGFDRENVRRVGIPFDNQRTIYASVCGKKLQEIRDLQTRYKGIMCGHDHQACLDFLRSNVSDLSCPGGGDLKGAV